MRTILLVIFAICMAGTVKAQELNENAVHLSMTHKAAFDLLSHHTSNAHKGHDHSFVVNAINMEAEALRFVLEEADIFTDENKSILLKQFATCSLDGCDAKNRAIFKDDTIPYYTKVSKAHVQWSKVVEAIDNK